MLRRTFFMLLVLYVILPIGHGGANTPVDSNSESQVVVFYFHRTARCQSCLKMEVEFTYFCGHLRSAI